MTIFSTIYEAVLNLAEHPHAPIYLSLLSFIEAVFFPIPPDLMLIPMSISRPQFAFRYATLTTLTSVLGGIVGYLLGMYFMHLLEPYLVQFGYQAAYYKVKHWFLFWGFYTLFFTGLTPIPYKVFTLASGAVGMPVLPFIFASLVGRGSRFYLVSALVRVGGEKMRQAIKTYINWMGG